MGQDPEEVFVNDRQLVCHHCGATRFHTRTVAMHGAGASFFGLEWFTQQGAFCHVCSDCGHVYWFLPKT
jgi:predicted nucleic-acid-binding Zn-ribbon protein